MNKINIRYFSGTGNSKRAALIIQRFFDSKNYQGDIAGIAKSNPQDFKPARVNIFLFPVYSFCIPHIMEKYLKKLPKSGKSKAAVIATFGAQSEIKAGNEGHSLVQAENILVKKGFDVFFADAVPYPCNFTQVVNTLTKEQIKKVYIKSDALVVKMAGKIMAGEKYHKPCSKLKSFSVSLFDWSFVLLGRRFFGKLFTADNKCINCGICVKECPVEAIKLMCKKPFWNYKCQACQRCINICPQKAIQTSLVRIMIFTALLIAFCFVFLTDLIKGNLFLLASHTISYAVVFWILDFMIRQCEKIKFLSPLFTLNHTKKFRRYIAGLP